MHGLLLNPVFWTLLCWMLVCWTLLCCSLTWRLSSRLVGVAESRQSVLEVLVLLCETGHLAMEAAHPTNQGRQFLHKSNAVNRNVSTPTPHHNVTGHRYKDYCDIFHRTPHPNVTGHWYKAYCDIFHRTLHHTVSLRDTDQIYCIVNQQVRVTQLGPQPACA